MSPRLVMMVAGVCSGIALLVPIGLYAYFFGSSFSEQHTRWAEFGSYFGGVLAPVFAMLAFLAVLYTIYVQAQHISKESRKADLTRVVNSIDQEIERILDEFVSTPETQPHLNFYHMAHEAELQQDMPTKTGSYLQFLNIVRTQGTVVGANYRRLVARLSDLIGFVNDYNGESPKLTLLKKYYSGKYSFLKKMLEDEGSASRDVRKFFR